MMPDTCVPTSTSVTGSTVPVAMTEFRIVMRLVVAVSSVIPSRFGVCSSSHAPPTTTTATAVISAFFRFIVYCVF